MAFADAENAIEQRLTSLWARPTVPLVFGNSGTAIPVPPFLLVVIAAVDERLEAFGGGRTQNEYNTFGRIEGYAHVPLTSGLVLARAIRDDFCTIFRSQRFSGVSCFGATPFGGGERPDKGQSYVLAAVVDFEHRFKG
jgi:hypothetical protein